MFAEPGMLNFQYPSFFHLQLLFLFLDERNCDYPGADTVVFLSFLLDRMAANVYTARRTLKIYSLSSCLHNLKSIGCLTG